MTERLDRIETQQEKNTNDIGDLVSLSRGILEAVDTLAKKADTLVKKIDDSNERFETLRLEAQADREEFRRSWNDAVTQMARDRVEARERAAIDRTRAQEGADADRADNAKRFDAQQEVIQRLLVELVEMNRDNRRLRDRLDGLERAS